jgi:hypothetical protein
VALVAAQQIIIQFYESGVNAANNTAAADDRATADNEDAIVGAKVGGDTPAEGPAADDGA